MHSILHLDSSVKVHVYQCDSSYCLAQMFIMNMMNVLIIIVVPNTHRSPARL